MFARTGVFSPVELESRYEVYAEVYIKSIAVEAKLVADIAKTIIYPAAMRYLSELAATNASVRGMGIDLDISTAKTIAKESNEMMSEVVRLIEASAKEEFATMDEHMQYCAKVVRGLMDEVRLHADALEAEIADEQWPLPKYREMLFIK